MTRRRRRRAPWWAGPSLLCDLTIGLLRLPAIIGSVLILWPILVAAARLAGTVADHPVGPGVLLAAAGVCLAAGVTRGRHRTGFGHLGTLEHELAHAVVALATFHPVTGASVRRDSGHVTYASVTGKGNWLIGIAPYVLPIVPIAVIVGMTAAGLGGTPIGAAAVGVAVGWHLLATMAETRGHQPDLQRLGRPTWVPVVAAATLIEVVLVIGWAADGIDGVAAVMGDTGAVAAELAGPAIERIRTAVAAA